MPRLVSGNTLSSSHLCLFTKLLFIACLNFEIFLGSSLIVLIFCHSELYTLCHVFLWHITASKPNMDVKNESKFEQSYVPSIYPDIYWADQYVRSLALSNECFLNFSPLLITNSSGQQTLEDSNSGVHRLSRWVCWNRNIDVSGMRLLSCNENISSSFLFTRLE